jgi:topoisomerase-4 subunit B
LRKILQAEQGRKLSGIRKLAKDRNFKIKRLSRNNKKRNLEIFLSEGDSRFHHGCECRGSFSLRLNSTVRMNKKIVYENEEFNLLQAALDIEDDMENLRYNNIVLQDADVDGMHIRLLLITFLQFFPELIKDGHLYILQTPL